MKNLLFTNASSNCQFEKKNTIYKMVNKLGTCTCINCREEVNKQGV